LNKCRHVLEIGSGTGQHAVYFADRIPHIIWHTSDLPDHHEGIHRWIDESHLANVRAPRELDMSFEKWHVNLEDHFEDIHLHAIYSANTTHIMPETCVQNMILGAGNLLKSGGQLIIYGPFKYKQAFTSSSNAKFDHWLKQRNPTQGIRDFERLNAWANQSGLSLQQDYPMPANNRLLCWRKC